MDGPVVRIRANRLAHTTRVPPPFLFIQEKVFCFGHDALVLQPCCHGMHTGAREVRISAETLPIAPTPRNTSEWASDWEEGDVDAFAAVLLAESFAVAVHEIFVKGCANGDLGREGGDKFLPANSVRCVCKAEIMVSVRP